MAQQDQSQIELLCAATSDQPQQQTGMNSNPALHSKTPSMSDEAVAQEAQSAEPEADAHPDDIRNRTCQGETENMDLKSSHTTINIVAENVVITHSAKRLQESPDGDRESPSDTLYRESLPPEDEATEKPTDINQDSGVFREIKIKPGRTGYGSDIFPGKEDLIGTYLGQYKTEHPLTSRRVFDKLGVHNKTVLKFNSRDLLTTLVDILAPSRTQAYQKLESPKPGVRWPYVLLFHNRAKILETLATKPDDKSTALLRVLLDFLKSEALSSWQKLDELESRSCRRIFFKDVWLLYRPGTTVYTRSSGEWEAYKVDHIEVNNLPRFQSVTIFAYRLDFDETGSCLVPSQHTLYQPPYAGERLIGDLEIIPESHLDNEAAISNSLAERGRAFWEFHGAPGYRQYNGDAWPITLHADSVKVIVDYSTSNRYDSGASLSDERLPLSFPHYLGPIRPPEVMCDCDTCVAKYAGLASYRSGSADVIRDASLFCPKDVWANRMTPQAQKERNLDSFLKFCPSRVYAFSLKYKSWRLVKLDDLKPIVPREDPFQKLVLDNDFKEVVQAMVETKDGNGRNSVSDLIKEKGRGLVILLHGGPGTGKTLTAECVAENKAMPLYMVTCGDLGTNPDTLEKRLEEAFLRAVNWHAVLLLDEADVFLQERDLHDINRNALVSVFLRRIEYYDGILFLTTNRPGQIDEAFQSRIHITLGLPELDFRRQKEVWKIFINQLKISATDKAERTRIKKELIAFVWQELEGELKSSGYQMNGRQIRNCMRAAAAIANKKERAIQKDDILTIIRLGTQFRDYMSNLNRMNQNEKAQALGLRFMTPVAVDG